MFHHSYDACVTKSPEVNLAKGMRFTQCRETRDVEQGLAYGLHVKCKTDLHFPGIASNCDPNKD